MIRKIVSALFLIVGLAVAGPAVRVESTTFDGGSVPENSKVNAIFRLTNTGTKPLKILSLRTGCGCTVAEYDTVIAPGKTGTIRPVLDVTGFRPGRMTRGINVTTNATNSPALTLTIEVIITPTIEVSEHHLDFQGQANQTVFISSAKKDLQITGILFRPNRLGGGGMQNWADNVPLNINYKLTPTDSSRADGLKVYRLDIASPSTERGDDNELAGSFLLQTNHPERREIIIGGRIR